MIRSWLKMFLLLMGIISLGLIARNIKSPFWQDVEYQESILSFQKDQDLMPYRLRVWWWNKSVVLKTILERTVDLVWTGSSYYLAMIYLLVLAFRKRWLNFGLIVIGLVLIAIEKDPNPGSYLWWLSPFVISAFIK
ncbi:hypothetical protein KKD37_02770 [Patescibacteria group bacterium]|nr:hypothetical protein [Patescibacteria group bacterium]